eukprot:CAMPEP_0184672458 /NCGR_PEP_ID=MMETSP0308-20130426/86111_1 /TAXON_ID=38269 /ORGANISM="Gloeochaete witrockiana, Strain SAG 46.84" /LENGTH=303 /DNA_ID=CAMNT_0027119785 /DNA_START=12 /DNA_END=923 /DNA_ORIENTATION=+
MRSKVLLMGKQFSGKTSMRSIIFANYIPRDTTRLGATLEVELSQVRLLGNLVLNLWDCGGQKTFMENYFESQRDHIFRNVEVLIYVFDIVSLSSENTTDLDYFRSCLEALKQHSKAAKIFVLVHKMDLIDSSQREQTFKTWEKNLMGISQPLSLQCFSTSIWDETLYKAWSTITYTLIPNVKVLEVQLQSFCEICEADEIVLFERATFLVISNATRKQHRDMHRFEKISNIIKQFKLSCSKTQAAFNGMEVRNSNFTAFIDVFTTNTYIMVVVSNLAIRSAVTLANIQMAKPHFERLVLQSVL